MSLSNRNAQSLPSNGSQLGRNYINEEMLTESETFEVKFHPLHVPGNDWNPPWISLESEEEEEEEGGGGVLLFGARSLAH